MRRISNVELANKVLEILEERYEIYIDFYTMLDSADIARDENEIVNVNEIIENYVLATISQYDHIAA